MAGFNTRCSWQNQVFRSVGKKDFLEQNRSAQIFTEKLTTKITLY